MQPDGSEQRPVLESNSTIEWTPALSPDGKKIAFARTLRRRDPHSDIYVMGSDGSNVTRLTDHPSEEGFPTWSPDGLRIAFQAGVVGFPDPPWPTDGAARIHVIDADGSNRTRLTENDAAETTPNGLQTARVSCSPPISEVTGTSTLLTRTERARLA